MSREIWDAYDKDDNKLGYDLFRDEPVPTDVYHIVVEIYVFSHDGRVLITQRAANKTYPLKWENTGGSILKGETPIQGAIRELKEETGIAVTESQLKLAYTEVKHPPIYKCFVAIVDGNEKITLQEGETVDYKWLPYEEYLELLKTDEFVDRVADSFMRHIDEIEEIVQLRLK
ncbi:MAG: NUDIX domain-containing protein [Candidatus Ornithomonoglobus sp.]